jgi:hypothetical protein
MGRRFSLIRWCGFIEMLPFERLLVESRLGGQVFCQRVQPRRIQHGEGLAPHLREREAASNGFICEQLEKLATLCHVSIRSHPEIVNQQKAGFRKIEIKRTIGYWSVVAGIKQ